MEMTWGISQPMNAFFELPDYICVGLYGRFDEDCAASACPLEEDSSDVDRGVSIALM